MKKIVLILFALCCIPVSASAQTPHSNTITWAASTGTVSGYNVYRFAGICAGTPLSSFTRLNPTPITALTWTDSGMADGAVNCYYVAAVGTDAAKTESQSSGTLLCVTPTFTANAAPPPPGRPTGSVQ